MTVESNSLQRSAPTLMPHFDVLRRKMNEKEKREAFFTEMIAAGAKKNEQMPPLYRLLWSLGINIPPPLYSTGGQGILVNMILGGGFWGLFMWLFAWRESPEYAAAGGFIFGLLFSFLIHFKMESQRKKYGISGDWSDYKPNEHPKAEP